MAAHHNRQRGPLRRGGASQLRAAPSCGRRRGSQLPAPPPALSPEPPRSSRASSHRAVGLHRSLAAQHGTFRARVASSAPPRPGRRPPEGEERGKPRRGAQKSARPGGFGAARRNAGHSSRREGRTAAAPPRRPARPRPPTGRSRRCRAPPPSFPHAKCPLVTPVPPRPALPRRSPQLLPAPPGPAPVPVAQRLSSGCGSPRGSGFRAHAHLAPTRGWRRARCAEPGAGLPPPLSLRRGARSGRAPHLFAGPTEESKEAPQNRQPTV